MRVRVGELFQALRDKQKIDKRFRWSISHRVFFVIYVDIHGQTRDLLGEKMSETCL